MPPSARQITPHVRVADCYGDEFGQGVAYTNWRPDGSGDYLLIHTVEGGGLLGTGGALQPSRVGDVHLYASSACQEYQTDPEIGHWQLCWIHFQPHPDWGEWLDWPMSDAPGLRKIAIRPPDRSLFLETLRQAVRLSRSTELLATPLAMNALEAALLHALRSYRRTQRQRDPRVEEAAQELATRDPRLFTILDAARIAGLSPSRFAHLFREEMGISPHAYAQQCQLRRAARLLTMTSLSVAEIAEQSGFENPFYFSNRFHKLHGCSPSAYRKRSTLPRRQGSS